MTDALQWQLTLLTLPNCRPCETVKVALDDPALAEFGTVGTRRMTGEDARRFRGEDGVLRFPILLAHSGPTLCGTRIGATSSDPEEERSRILAWLESLRAGDDAAAQCA